MSELVKVSVKIGVHRLKAVESREGPQPPGGKPEVPETEDRVSISPAARRLASEHGRDCPTCNGTQRYIRRLPQPE